MENLKYVFEPQSIAVIGASSTEETVGNAVFSNILNSGFNGTLYPVNPKYTNIMSVKAYADVMEISDPVDLAIICVPVKVVLETLEQCVKKGIKGIVLITAGFKEMCSEGKILEDKITAISVKNNINLIGPNCLGIVNTSKDVKLNANFAFKMPQSGNIGLISQSGAIGIIAIDYAKQQNLGISKFASIGNKAVIDETDVLEYLINDEDTKIITMYLEDIKNPARFLEMANKAALIQKPIIVIKTGTSVRGAVSTQSHTGALSSSDIAYDSLFEKCGVIRVETLEELFEYAKGFTCKGNPEGNQIVILTNGGGMGIIATDASEKYNLKMITFESSISEELKKEMPAMANINNPVDIIGDADSERFSKALSIIVKDKNVNSIIVSVIPTVKTDMNSIATVICKYAKENPKLTFLSNLLSFDPESVFKQILSKEKIPNFNFPEISVRVLSTMVKYYNWVKQPIENSVKLKVNKDLVQKTLNELQKENRINLTEPESYKILEAYGMNSIENQIAKNLNEALIAAKKIGYPVVLKIISPDIAHKIDVGGVKINLKDDAELKKAFNEMTESVKSEKPEAHIHGFLIGKFLTEKSIEIIVGAKAIKGFGHLIMFGFGGTFVELYKDVSFRLAPLSKKDVLDMIKETKGYLILKGYRGQASYDIDGITESILRVSQLVTDFPIIKELDMNPIKVLEDSKGLIVIDAKIVLEEHKDSDVLLKSTKKIRIEETHF